MTIFLLKLEFNYLNSSKQWWMWLLWCHPWHSISACTTVESCTYLSGRVVGWGWMDMNWTELWDLSQYFVCWSCSFAGQFCVSNMNLHLAFSPLTDCPLADVSSSLSVCALLTMTVECILTDQHGDVWTLFTWGTQKSLHTIFARSHCHLKSCG